MVVPFYVKRVILTLLSKLVAQPPHSLTLFMKVISKVLKYRSIIIHITVPIHSADILPIFANCQYDSFDLVGF